jgi:hypothetical protein
VAINRRVAEFSTLSVRGRTGFTLQGSGTATVRTTNLYAPRVRYRVRIRSRTGTRTRTVRSSRTGTLTLPVALGPSDTVQEYTVGRPPGPSAGTTVDTTAVSIARVRR